MSSPFATFEEFASAEGPIYTFAGNPTMITLLLIVSFILTVYFFYASFGMKQELEVPLDAKAVGLLLVAGLTTIATTLFQPQVQKQATQARSFRTEQSSRRIEPLALLGMIGLGGATYRRSGRSLSQKSRVGKRSRLR